MREAPPEIKQPFAKAFHAARAAGAEPEWRPAAQPSEHLAYFVGKAGMHGFAILQGSCWGSGNSSYGTVLVRRSC